MVEKKASGKEKEPRKQREIIGAEKIRRRQAEKRRHKIGVPRRRELCERPASDANVSVRHMLRHEKEQKAHAPRHSSMLRQPRKKRLRQSAEDHRRADASEHAENDPRRRHHRQRHHRHRQPGEGHLHPALHRMGRKRQAEAGDKDERPADRLLPERADRAQIPLPIKAVEIDQVPDRVVEDHVHDRQTADAVDQRIALCHRYLPPFRFVCRLSGSRRFR